ncbi:MAG TPA: energy transducer TonB [Ramlibacter sp.]|uniref:energy transducer TonB n=1 Tax=Ramlibacter sp. TaxID=1917967 RepID=UPI002B593A1B|nr:energy transducer TonB [Ramlibacter sp.]HVZ46855.1 energy transducer TonB [Ramlibacter sp.]
MDVAAERSEFAPPPQPGLVRGFLLALLAHALLLVALTWGLRWQREAQDVSAEAELWSAVPQQAAPKEIAPPPPPPQPVQKVEPKPEPPKPREPDINLERDKQKRIEALKRARDEELREQRERERAQALKREQEQQRLAEERRQKLEEEREKEREKKRKEKLQEERLAKLRDENLKRLQGMAGGTATTPSPGAAARSSGPSSSWGSRVRARVKPNIVFADDVRGNPTAEVEVRLAPDGTIVGKRLVKSSGVGAWDDAVLRALDKTEVLPRDTDGRVPSPVILEFRPKD